MKRSHQRRSSSGPNHKKDKSHCLSRKANRKAARKKKKEQMNQKYLQRFSKSKPDPEVLKETTEKKKDFTKKKRGPEEDYPNPEKPSEKTKSVKKNRKLNNTERIKIRPDNEEDIFHEKPYQDAVMAREQKQLKQLEKQLKLKKSSSLPKSFQDDGLDFLLDVVDHKKLYGVVRQTEDLKVPKPIKEAVETKEKQRSSLSSKSPSENRPKKVRFQLDNSESDQDEPGEDLLDESEEDGSFGETENSEEMDLDNDSDAEQMVEDDEDDVDDDDDMGTDEEEESDAHSEVREDIYGRLVDKKGQLLSDREQGGAYIPPAKRAAMLAGSGQESVELERLKKQVKGLLNRANESNMQSIAKAVEDMYMQHSRASVNQTLFKLVQEAVVSSVLTPERLVAEMAMLVAILHGNVGSEVGAYFLQHVCTKYEQLRQEEQYGGEHTMDNVVLLLCYLYNFKVAHHSLLFDVITQFVESFSEKDIELLLLVMKTAGFYLRRDDPELLGNQISSIQQKARELEESGTTVPARVRFMLEVLVAVRNNNVRRVPGADIERTDRLRQLAGKFIRAGGLADNQLNIGMKDLLQAEHKGRWWIVGSAWEGRLNSDTTDSKVTANAAPASSVVGAVSQKLVHLAKKLRINSDLRRSIFFVLMSSEDYEDAFQRVLQLGLKGPQQQEIVVVATLCCKQESTYNPFYSFFLQKLAAHERKFMIAIQFHMWDTFKTMEDLNSSSRNNLAAMLAHLLASKSLSLSVLKVLEFGVLNKAVIKFLKHVFTTLFSTVSMAELRDIFRAVGQLQKFKVLSDGLRTFLVKYIKVEGEQKQKLVEVYNELSLNHNMLM